MCTHTAFAVPDNLGSQALQTPYVHSRQLQISLTVNHSPPSPFACGPAGLSAFERGLTIVFYLILNVFVHWFVWPVRTHTAFRTTLTPRL